MRLRGYIGIVLAALTAAGSAWATNGDNLIGIGPVSRAMGGVGVAAPQDSITAIFQNPAGMSFCPCGEKSEAVFGGDIFNPSVNAKVTTPMGTYSGDSQHDVFVIPAMGVTTPINEQWRFGLGAYGISGLGVDYRNKGWDLDPTRDGAEGDVYTKLEIMKFAGMLSYNVNENLGLGLALNGTYNNLDLGYGGSHDYAFGLQLGALYAIDMWSFGLSYTSPETAGHERVADLDGDGSLDTLDLEAPHAFVGGVAFIPNDLFLIEADVKHYTWSSADGYGDFDWDDQTVFAIGAQYSPTADWDLRVGYNYGENPVNLHNGFDPMGVTQMQGKNVPTMNYEYLRIIGFPAIVEHHLTLGVGYAINETIRMDLGYLRAFAKDVEQTSAGDAITLASELEEDSLSFSLSFAF